MNAFLLLFSLQASEEDRVLVCCHESSLVAIRKSHDVVQTCFDELCQSAIKTICQVQHILMVCTECILTHKRKFCFHFLQLLDEIGVYFKITSQILATQPSSQSLLAKTFCQHLSFLMRPNIQKFRSSSFSNHLLDFFLQLRRPIKRKLPELN